jgi:hypothetical protein
LRASKKGSSSMPEFAGPTCGSVEWRRLGDYLWVGATDEGPVGTIEHGRRFSAIDTSGSVIARCRDLTTAQAVLAGRGPTSDERGSDLQREDRPRRRHAA